MYPRFDDNLSGSRRKPVYISTAQRSLIPQLYLLLSTAIEMLGADKGNIQFFSKRRNVLKIMVQIGFKDDFLRQFSSVVPGDAACGAAFKSKKRVIIADVNNDPQFSHLSAVFKNHGYAAVQSTPLIDGRGQVFGILSTHFAKPHHPDEQALAVLDVYLSKAVPIILRRRQAIKVALDPDESFTRQLSFPFLENV